MTILERIRPGRRPIEFGRIAQDLMNRDRAALERDAAGVMDQVNDIREAAADAIEAVQQLASDAVGHAGDAVGDLPKDVPVDRGLDKVDGRVEDLVERIRKALPTERITTLVTNLERDLPTTDGDRYDRAFRRGFARARTSFVVVGAATGIAAGIVGAYLLDPQRGPQRRNALRARVRSASDGVSTQVRHTATMTVERARGLAAERGLVKPDGTTDNGFARPAATPLVPVMDPTVGGSPVMPLGGAPATDQPSIEREPMATAGVERIAGGSADEPRSIGLADDGRLAFDASASTSGVEARAGDVTLTGGEDADRGTWHRTM